MSILLSRHVVVRALVALGLIGVASWALGGSPYAMAAAADKVESVFITNDQDSEAVATRVVGTPSVKVDASGGALPVSPQGTTAVDGTVGIDPARNTVQVAGLPQAGEPFQQNVAGDSEDAAGLSCTPIASPDSGKLLEITNVRIVARATEIGDATLLHAFLRPVGQFLDEFVDVAVALTPSGASPRTVHGTLDETLFHGTVHRPSTKSFTYTVCVAHRHRQLNSIAEFKAVVTGRLLAL